MYRQMLCAGSGVATHRKRCRVILRRFCGEIVGVISGNIGLRLDI